MTVTRFAPSPTGYLHIGNLRAALFNWLIARKAGGTFILRFDDTDPERSKQEYVDAIREDLEWLGLDWDREERQSLRLDRYDAAADQLRADGRLYEAFETPTELDLKRKKQLNMGKPPVYDRAALTLSNSEREALRSERGNGHWRFKLDHERIEWTDGILGEISVDASSVSDPVLIRGDGQYLYTLASVVDDTEMGVTDIVRGSDHVTNTATQLQIIEALGAAAPRFAHHSLLTGPQGEALSKRLGTLALRDLRAAGVEPMAILSLMSRLGSADPVELRASLGEIVEGFDVSRFGSAPTKLDPAKVEEAFAEAQPETMAETYERSVKEFEEDTILTGRVLNVVNQEVIVDIGYKSEGVIPLAEFGEHADRRHRRRGRGAAGRDRGRDGHDPSFQAQGGPHPRLERDPQDAQGRRHRKIKGGLLVDIGVPVFLPASQVDIRRPADIGEYIGKTIEAQILKIDEQRRNIVISRRKLIEERAGREAPKAARKIKEGDIRQAARSRTSPTSARSSTSAGSTACCTSPTCPGRGSTTRARLVSIDQEIEVKILQHRPRQGEASRSASSSACRRRGRRSNSATPSAARCAAASST